MRSRVIEISTFLHWGYKMVWLVVQLPNCDATSSTASPYYSRRRHHEVRAGAGLRTSMEGSKLRYLAWSLRVLFPFFRIFCHFFVVFLPFVVYFRFSIGPCELLISLFAYTSANFGSLKCSFFYAFSIFLWAFMFFSYFLLSLYFIRVFRVFFYVVCSSRFCAF